MRRAGRLPRARLRAPRWERFRASLRAVLTFLRRMPRGPACAFCAQFVPPETTPAVLRIFHETHLAVDHAHETIEALAAGRPPPVPARPFLWTRRRRRGLFRR